MSVRSVSGLLALLSCLLILWGCASTPPSRFYILHPLASAEGEDLPGVSDNLTLLVGPVELADYLDRPQIVTRSGPGKLELAEFDKWSEPLKDSIARVVVENLSSLLGTNRIAVYPMEESMPVDFQILMNVNRLDASESGEVVLDCRWRVLREEGYEVLTMQRSRITETAGSEGFEALVEAQSRALGRLSREIAQELVRLARP